MLTMPAPAQAARDCGRVMTCEQGHCAAPRAGCSGNLRRAVAGPGAVVRVGLRLPTGGAVPAAPTAPDGADDPPRVPPAAALRLAVAGPALDRLRPGRGPR